MTDEQECVADLTHAAVLIHLHNMLLHGICTAYQGWQAAAVALSFLAGLAC